MKQKVQGASLFMAGFYSYVKIVWRCPIFPVPVLAAYGM